MTIRPHEERRQFWSKVAKRGRRQCWLISGSGKRRYGRGKANGRWEQSQRAAWIFTHGPIPEGKRVLHSCDVPRCCNPGHLFLGTQLDNVRDCIAKGRSRRGHAQRGEAHHFAKLTRRQALAIRSAYARGDVRQLDLAQRYRISHGQVSRIINGQRWAA